MSVLTDLLAKGELPTVEVEVSNNTLVHLGAMIVISLVIVMLVSTILKMIIKA